MVHEDKITLFSCDFFSLTVSQLHTCRACLSHLMQTFYILLICKVKNAKSFPSLETHIAVLISISLVLSQTPVYTAKAQTRSYCIT